jgi:superfamily II RNA helicase
MSNKLQWDKPYEMLDILSQLQKLGANSFNPINLRKNDTNLKKHKNKKAQIIIEQSIKDDQIRKQTADSKIYDVVIQKIGEMSISIPTILNILSNIKTKKYKILLLLNIGKDLILNRKNKELIFHIYIALKLEDSFIPKEARIDVEKFYTHCTELIPNIIDVQMNKFSEYIYPKDIFNTELPTLDDWQKLLLNNIDNKKNVLLVAPTSAGKTNLAVHVVEVSDRTLFVVPTDAVARQVAGMLLNLKYSVALITARENIIQNATFKVLVGTPIELENFIVANPDIIFTYMICDEIHHIGAKENTSSAFERLLKGLNTCILAMSATVGNPEVIKKWLEETYDKPFEFINHTKRFINQQKHLFLDNKIVPLHPLSTISKEYLKKNGFTSSITFTARDLYQLYKTSEMECFSPYSFFTTNIITHNELLNFEEHCKKKILELIKDNNDLFLNKFQINNDKIIVNNYLNIITLLFKNKMYPSLLFTNSYKECMDTYKKIIDILEKEEEQKYPFYKENNKFRHEHFQEFMKEKHKVLQKVEIPKDCTNSQDYLSQIEQGIIDTYVEKLHNEFKLLTTSRLRKISDNTTYSIEEKERLTKLCQEDLSHILKLDTMIYIDPYRPHSEFTFTTSITSDKMRKLKNRLSKALEHNIDYTHTFLRGLERGIIVYHSQLQTPFQNEIQTLIIQKEVNFIIADESLGAGVNMPIKTVVLLGDDFSKWDYNKAQQMCGRSGRRGIDREGHIIYAGSNWKSIIANPSMNIIGADIVSEITILPEFMYKEPNTKYIHNCYKKTLQEFIDNTLIEPNRITKFQNTSIQHKSLIWNLRYIDNCLSFNTIYDDLVNVNKIYELCSVILTKVTLKEDKNIMKCLKENIITINNDSLFPFKLRLIGIILIKLHEYQPLIVRSFETIKTMLFKLDKTF